MLLSSKGIIPGRVCDRKYCIKATSSHDQSIFEHSLKNEIPPESKIYPKLGDRGKKDPKWGYGKKTKLNKKKKPPKQNKTKKETKKKKNKQNKTKTNKKKTKQKKKQQQQNPTKQAKEKGNPTDVKMILVQFSQSLLLVYSHGLVLKICCIVCFVKSLNIHCI